MARGDSRGQFKRQYGDTKKLLSIGSLMDGRRVGEDDAAEDESTGTSPAWLPGFLRVFWPSRAELTPEQVFKSTLEKLSESKFSGKGDDKKVRAAFSMGPPHSPLSFLHARRGLQTGLVTVFVPAYPPPSCQVTDLLKELQRQAASALGQATAEIRVGGWFEAGDADLRNSDHRKDFFFRENLAPGGPKSDDTRDSAFRSTAI